MGGMITYLGLAHMLVYGCGGGVWGGWDGWGGIVTSPTTP